MKKLVTLILFLISILSLEVYSKNYCVSPGGSVHITDSSCGSLKQISEEEYNLTYNNKGKNIFLSRVLNAGISGFFSGAFIFLLIGVIGFISLFIFNIIRKKNIPEDNSSLKSKISKAANTSAATMQGVVSDEELKEIYFKTLKETASQITNEEEEEIYIKVSKEFNSDQRKEGTWTKSLIEAEGEEKKAKIIYMKLRVKQLFAELIESKNN